VEPGGTNGASNPRGDTEDRKLEASFSHEENWQRWGTYLPKRQWGTVREDYSADGDPWTYFPYDVARSRAYRWGEDGLLGWTDRECRLCFSTSLWNGQDSHLKERLFGLSNPEGNHGEDVKELYYYLDGVPSGSFAKALYKYPQRAFPYDDLIRSNAERGFGDSEYELIDTGVFDEDRYFDVQVEYAKHGVDDPLIRLTLTNKGPDPAPLWVLPTVTLRNDWSWDKDPLPGEFRPSLRRDEDQRATLAAQHATLGDFIFTVLDAGTADDDDVQVLLTENETNFAGLSGQRTMPGTFTKDAFNRYVVHREESAVRSSGTGTKAAFLFSTSLPSGATKTIHLRLVRSDSDSIGEMTATDADLCFDKRKCDADHFYAQRLPEHLTPEERLIARQAYAGLLWSKQFYHYVADRWLAGDATQPGLPESTLAGRNANWRHMFCRDVLSVPDKWEYPWFAAWDSAFHMIPMADIDPHFAKHQLTLLLREWYMHPNGQMAAYEYAFGDVNPPVHAWAALEVYRIDAAQHGGKGDTDFLERCFQKLLLNFTWWVNRQDAEGRNLFAGGFLGLDNIGVFDRSMPLNGIRLQQADGTAWMGFYCASMLKIALELAQHRSVYEDIASKFLEHYVTIVDALNHSEGSGLWDDEAGFYFDHLLLSTGETERVGIRSVVGLIPLFGIAVLHRQELERLKSFRSRLDWFLKHRPALARHITTAETGEAQHRGDLVLSLVPKDRLQPLLAHVFDEAEFLSDFGIRSLSRFHHEHPYTLELNGQKHEVRYLSAEGDSALFGGNSNWRGPIWMPMNKLLRDAMTQYGVAFGSKLLLEYPTGSGRYKSFAAIGHDLDRRMLALFQRDPCGRRPVHGKEPRYQEGHAWEDLLLFSEYFCGDSGRGIGASHQTGWTALIASTLRNMEAGSPSR